MNEFKNLDILFYASGENAGDSLQRAARFARNTDSKLVVVDVIDALSDLERVAIAAVMPAAELQELRRARCREKLAGLVSQVKRKDVRVETKILEGRPFIEVIREVLRHNRDLVVKPDEYDRALGSTDMHLIRKCPCPVWITKEGNRPKYRKVMAAVDLDPADKTNATLNDEILRIALSLAEAEGAKLHVIHAWHLVGEGAVRGRVDVGAVLLNVMSERRALLDSLIAKHGCPTDRTHIHLVKGFPERVVRDITRAEGIDVLVMGSVGRVGLAGFFVGNTAETILSQVTCSVLTLKPTGFRTPVSVN